MLKQILFRKKLGKPKDQLFLKIPSCFPKSLPLKILPWFKTPSPGFCGPNVKKHSWKIGIVKKIQDVKQT